MQNDKVMKLSEREFINHIITEICDYAALNGYEVTDTVKTMGENLAAITEVATFDGWEVKTPTPTHPIPIDTQMYIQELESRFERIVEQLEEESDFFGGEPMGSLQKAYYCKGITKAIEIVRNGGKE